MHRFHWQRDRQGELFLRGASIATLMLTRVLCTHAAGTQSEPCGVHPRVAPLSLTPALSGPQRLVHGSLGARAGQGGISGLQHRLPFPQACGRGSGSAVRGSSHCKLQSGRVSTLNFVTHSLGGIIVRQLAASGLVRNFGRVVMLGPPNHGTELVDTMGEWSLFRLINGPAGGELGTSPGALPQQLGPVRFQAGVVAGSSPSTGFTCSMASVPTMGGVAERWCWIHGDRCRQGIHPVPRGIAPLRFKDAETGGFTHDENDASP